MDNKTTPEQRKTEFFWASIAGADPEPVEMIEREGRKGVLTIGCPDPFWLDDKAARVRLHHVAMERPEPLQTQRQRDAAERAYQREKKARGMHSWRGPR